MFSRLFLWLTGRQHQCVLDWWSPADWVAAAVCWSSDGTLKALFVSAGMAMAAPLICSCIILDWSAPVGGDKTSAQY